MDQQHVGIDDTATSQIIRTTLSVRPANFIASLDIAHPSTLLPCPLHASRDGAFILMYPATGGLMERDVVCGMQVDPAKAAGKSEYNGKTYYFCAKACKTKFDANPGQYAK
jgi:Cu+-exporting ATPase